MIRQIAPQFFTTDIPGTVAYYKEKLGFECLDVARPAGLCHRDTRPARDPLPLCGATHNQPGQICRRTARRLSPCGRCRRALCGVRCQRRGVHSETGEYAMAFPRVCSEGLRRPFARLRHEPVTARDCLTIIFPESFRSEGILCM